MERGLRIARVDTVVKLRDALEVPSDNLLAGIVWNSGHYRPGGFLMKGEEEG